MAGFCATQQSLGLVESLLATVDCNVQAVSELGYRAVAAPDSQISVALTIMLTIYVAIFGMRLLLGIAPLRVGDLTVSALKIGLIVAMATSWPTYQQLVFNTLFRGPEQIASSMMVAMQPPGSQLRGNPFDGLQIAYDQLQSAAAFFARISPAASSPFSGGVPFAAFSLNSASFFMLFTTLGVILAAKVVLGLLLALGLVFITALLFDTTRGLFEGWLRAALVFAFLPLFATLALTVQLVLVEPYLIALAQMVSSGQPDLPAATAVFTLTFVASGVSLAGIAGIFVIALGFKIPRQTMLSRSNVSTASNQPTIRHPIANVAPTTPASGQPRVAAISAAVASLDRRDARLLDESGAPRRLNFGTSGDNSARRNEPVQGSYRRSAQPRRAASSNRRDK